MPTYEELSLLTSQFPELLIIRRFDFLSARVILARQAELLHLEEELRSYAARDANNPDIKDMLRSWGDTLEGEGDGHPILQVRKLREVDEKLKQYQETLLRVSQIQQLSPPSQQNRSRLWEWLRDPTGGNEFLKGTEARPWDPYGEQSALVKRDLSILKEGSDQLDSWLADAFVPRWHMSIGHKFDSNVGANLNLGELWEYSMKKLHFSGNVICFLLSSLGPIISIQTLYWIPSSVGRLGAICGFILVFAALMMFVSGCRRFEVFGATAAFAAVQVVFLQGLSGSVNCT